MWPSSCRSRLKCVTQSYIKHNITFYNTRLKMKIYNLPKEGI